LSIHHTECPTDPALSLLHQLLKNNPRTLQKSSQPQPRTHIHKNAFSNTNTHRPPGTSSSLTPPRERLPRPRRLSLPLQHPELKSESPLQLHLKNRRERLLPTRTTATQPRQLPQRELEHRLLDTKIEHWCLEAWGIWAMDMGLYSRDI